MNLEENPEEARLLLAKAVEMIPKSRGLVVWEEDVASEEARWCDAEVILEEDMASEEARWREMEVT